MKGSGFLAESLFDDVTPEIPRSNTGRMAALLESLLLYKVDANTALGWLKNAEVGVKLL